MKTFNDMKRFFSSRVTVCENEMRKAELEFESFSKGINIENFIRYYKPMAEARNRFEKFKAIKKALGVAIEVTEQTEKENNGNDNTEKI